MTAFDVDAVMGNAGLGPGDVPGTETSGTGQAKSRADVFRDALLDEDGLINLPPPAPLIEGVLYKSTLAMLYGESGSWKTFLALDWAMNVARGLPWQEHATRPGTVLYVAGEGHAGLGKRVRAWKIRHHADGQGRIRFMGQAPNLMDEGDTNAFGLIAGEVGAELIVLDTLARVAVGGDENSARDMGILVAHADQIRRATNATVLFVHHSGKDGGTYRGSSALKGAMDTLIKVEQVETAGGNDNKLKVLNEKQKDAEEFQPIGLQRDIVELPDGQTSVTLRAVQLGPEAASRSGLTTMQRKVLATLDGQDNPQTVEALAAHVNRSRTTVSEVLNELAGMGLADGEQGTKREPKRWWKK